MEVAGRKRFFVISTVLFLLMLPGAHSVAETRYVTDRLFLTLRSGPGKEHQALKMLKSNDALETMGEDGDFVFVRTSDGHEGWVEKQYLTSQIPKPIVIKGLEGEIERLKRSLEIFEKGAVTPSDLEKAKKNEAELKENLRKSTEDLSRTKEELKQIRLKYSRLKAESGRVEELRAGLDRLSAENERMKAQLLDLEKENQGFRRKQSIRWFLAGGGLLVAGILLGRSAPKKKTFY